MRSATVPTVTVFAVTPADFGAEFPAVVVPAWVVDVPELPPHPATPSTMIAVLIDAARVRAIPTGSLP